MPTATPAKTNTPDVVYIVDDDQDSREAVESLIGEMKVKYKSYESAEDFLDDYDGHRPGCLVTDVRMLRMSGLELQEELNRRGITLAVVVMTAYAETPVVVRALQNGAVTLIEKPCSDYELWDAVRAGLAADTKSYESEQERAAVLEKMESLTPSERAVLDRIVAGDANKAIAQQLDISVRTVEVRRQSLFAKLKADSVAQLVRIVLKSGEWD